MKNRILNKGKTACAVVAVVAGLMASVAGEASADVQSINYNIGTTGAVSRGSRIWSEGGTAAIQGTGISVADVFGRGTSKDAPHTITEGVLTFNSGLYNTNTNTYEHGTFTILGKFNATDTVSTTLLSGTIESLILDRSVADNYKISKAKLSVTDNALATYFGFNSATKFAGLMDLNFNVLPAAFEGATNGGNISTSPVPLPGAIWLFASGAAGLFGVRRRQLAC
jgi:hypothetical protein